MQKTFPSAGSRNLIAFVSISFITLSTLVAYGQQKQPGGISLSVQSASLREVLDKIQSLSGSNLVYSRDIFDLDKKITITSTNQPVETVLTNVLGAGYQFRRLDNNIVITKSGTRDNGRITGTVAGQQGELLVGASIFIRELSRGVSADANANFSLLGIPPGEYTLIVSYIGYQTKTVEGVSVKSGQTTALTITLAIASSELSEALIVGAIDVRAAEVKNSDEISLLKEIQKSDLIITGISNVQISRSLDFNAAEILQRAPSVSMINNFINIRGLYERYNMVFINNMMAPSSESDRRAFSFDLLPSGVIDKIIIHRNPAPELPGDFAGGLIKIHTKEAVTARQVQVRFSAQYREHSSFTDTYGYKSGNTDWLGFDDGTRALSSEIPGRGQLPGTSSAQEVAENAGYGRKLDSHWNLVPNKPVGLDYRGQINYYDSWKIGSVRLNNLSAVFYTREFQTVSQHFQIDPDSDPMVKYRDSIFYRTARIGAMQNFVLKINEHNRIHIDNFFNQLGRDETQVRSGLEPETTTDSLMQIQYSWRERSLYSGQVRGDHSRVGKNGTHNLQWGGGYAYTLENVPNERRYEIRYPDPDIKPLPAGYNQLMATDEIGGEGFEFNLQTYRKTEEKASSYFIDTEWALPASVKLKAGSFAELKKRQFDNRYITIRPGPSFEQEDESLELIGPSRQYVVSDLLGGYFRLDGTGFVIRDQTYEGSAYEAENTYYAGYVALGIPLFADRLNIYGGIRYEWNRQALTNERTEGIEVQDVDQLTRYWLPSLNVSWELTKSMLIRTAYAKSLNRPQFRELSAFSSFELDDGYLKGNPELITAEIQNVDLRWEYYPAEGEWLSAGLFYKNFKNPIEYISATQSNSIRARTEIRNTQGAQAYGVELEVRKNMGFLGGKVAKDFAVILNATYLWNEADLGADDVDYGNDLRDSKRPLQGTTPYLINATLYYDIKKTGTAFSTQYNTFGQRLYLAASTLRSDIFERPRHSLDFNVKQRLVKDLELQAGVKNIFNQAFRYYRDFYRDGKYDPDKVAQEYLGEGGNTKPGSDYYFRKYKEGRYFSVSVSYTIR